MNYFYSALALFSVLLVAPPSGNASELDMDRCIVVPPLPGSAAHATDSEMEQAFCSIDFGGASIAVCPKTWSTSPAAMVYELEGTDWEGKAGQFEREICPRGSHAREQARGELAFFKNSLNGRETSGTYAPASLLYYHFSRVLRTRVRVPAAVVAEFPVAAYLRELVLPGIDYSDSQRKKMLHAGWLEMQLALEDPQAYVHRSSLFAANDENLWGVLLLSSGRRYGAEINGTRASGWGEGQNRDFQKTAPFLALRKDLPLAQAIREGLADARRDPAMARALGADVSAVQLAWWMSEVAEIVLLDAILGQQDRIGNIDYQWRWVWNEGGLRMQESEPVSGIGARKVKVSWLNDNDAGAYSAYVNYASKTGMLDGWFHMDPGLYQRLQQLAARFRDNGPAAQALAQNYRLSSKEVQQILQRTEEAASALARRCEAGQLRFDLGLDNVLAPESAREQALACRVESDMEIPALSLH